MSAQRCDLNLTQCEDFGKITIPDVCRILNQRNSFWADFMTNTKPKLICPLKNVLNYRRLMIGQTKKVIYSSGNLHH